MKLPSPGCCGCQKTTWIQVKAQKVDRRKVHWGLSKAKRKHLWLQKVRERQIVQSWYLEEIPSLLLIPLPRNRLLATAGDGIWSKKDICSLAAQPLLWSCTSSGSHPLLTSIPLAHRRFPPRQPSWMLNGEWLGSNWGNENGSCGKRWWKPLP